MEISSELMNAIADAIFKDRERYSGADGAYAKTLGINGSVFSRLKKGERTGLLSTNQWLNIGRKLGVTLGGSVWNTVETDIYIAMESDFKFCQNEAEALLLVEDCGIGKTHCAKILVSKMQNAFYIDASQCKTKRLFIKTLAREVGCGAEGHYSEILANLKYYINALGSVFICIDEAGDLDYPAFLELKGLINGTAGRCGWFMMGADGLRAKMERGINNRKVGYKEIFDRFSAKFRTYIPDVPEERRAFYEKLFYDVAEHNIEDKTKINQMVKKCLGKTKKTENEETKSLRYLKTLIKIEKAA